jgi:hypothetical protein
VIKQTRRSQFPQSVSRGDELVARVRAVGDGQVTTEILGPIGPF